MTCRGSRKKRAGFTLVELLVVIAIIGTLVALLLPAIQSAREAARRSQCMVNLKNVALAVVHFNDAKGHLPPPVTLPDLAMEPLYPQRLFGSWAVDVLPYLEQQALFDSFMINATTRLSDAVNAVPRGTPLAVMRCPSDAGFNEPFEGAIEGTNWARGNYGLNGFQFWPNSDLNRQAAGVRAGSGGNDLPTMIDFNVGMGIVSSPTTTKWSLRRISDGTTNTIMLGEMRVGLHRFDRRGVWAMGMCGSNFHCRHAWNGATQPNDCKTGVDDTYGIQAVKDELGAATLINECMDAASVDSGQSVIRSVHVGGAFVALADASVRFITDFVDSGPIVYEAFVGRTAPPSPSSLGVWQRLNISADGMTFEVP
ncbi:MAG: DUF1559 domain-containing protein [Pirellulales bacterium]|nr:DUF1559 domain-containing protein [Pirellulales bacterium]